jgi:hypothetical protein
MLATISAYKRCSVLLYLQLFVGGRMSCLPCLCLYVYSGVQHMSCCVFLRLVYSMLPVSLFFSSSCVPYVTSFSVFYTSCVPYVTSFSGLFFFVLCTLCCQFLWIVFLRLVYPLLPVSLDCFSSSCVLYVASLSGLSICDCPFGIL